MTACTARARLPDGPALSAAETTFRWLARPYALLDDCAAAHGDTFTLRFTSFGTHVVVAHPDDVRDVLGADRETLHAGRGNMLLEPVVGKSSLLIVDGDRHVAQRALLQPVFRADRVQRYAAVVVEAARRWTAGWDGEVVGMQRTALEISKEIILRTVLGLPVADLARFSRLIHDVMVLVGTNATFAAESDGTPLHERFHAARAALRDALQEEMARRRAASAAAGDDLIGTLLAASLPDEEIGDQLVTMILAGHETTASSITWALLCLHGREADALRTLEAELDTDVPDERLAALPFLQAVCLETLRVRPVIPVVSREVQRPFRLRDRIVPPGVFVTPCAYLAQRRPESFPEPDAFRPERFLDGRFSPAAYFPFGGGVRRCIGQSFALLEMQIVVGMLVRGFRFAPVGAPAQPVRRGVTIVASGGGRMHVERRARPGGRG